MLLRGLEEPDGREAIRVGERALTYERLHAAAQGVEVDVSVVAADDAVGPQRASALG